jgi:hypothetical protein
MEETHMDWKSFAVSVLVAGCVIATAILMPELGTAQTNIEDRLKFSMAALKAKTANLGAPKIEGVDPVAGRKVPALYFGTTKMNNSSEVVDAVVREHGGMAALYVNSPPAANPNFPRFVSVTSSLKKDDGSSAIGGVMDPGRPLFLRLRTGEDYYGWADGFGDNKSYDVGAELIKEASGNVIGVYVVGYAR